jgi:hypothetical protein
MGKSLDCILLAAAAIVIVVVVVVAAAVVVVVAPVALVWLPRFVCSFVGTLILTGHSV